MKFIPQHKVDAIELKRGSGFFSKLSQVKLGAALLVERKEWTRKSPPGGAVTSWLKRSANPTHKFSVRALAGDTGWLIIRKK